MNNSILILIFLFSLAILLELVWMLTDYRSLGERIRWSFKPQTLLFSFEKGIAAVLLIVTTLYFPLPHTVLDSLLVVFGIMVGVIGFIIAGWAKLTMSKSWAPAEQDSPLQEKKLTTNDPFKFSRNPIYLGVILLALGTCIALRSYLIFIVIFPIIKFYKASIIEEKILEKKFGEPYLKYKNKVRRFI